MYIIITITITIIIIVNIIIIANTIITIIVILISLELPLKLERASSCTHTAAAFQYLLMLISKRNLTPTISITIYAPCWFTFVLSCLVWFGFHNDKRKLSSKLLLQVLFSRSTNIHLLLKGVKNLFPVRVLDKSY